MKIPETAELTPSILEDGPIVVLDTCTFANSKKPETYAYRAKFVELKNKGVRFVIPDVCLGEAMNLFNDPATEGSREELYKQWRKMAYWMRRYIWKEFPVFPTNAQ